MNMIASAFLNRKGQKETVLSYPLRCVTNDRFSAPLHGSMAPAIDIGSIAPPSKQYSTSNQIYTVTPQAILARVLQRPRMS